LPDLTLVDFFLFRKVAEELAGLHLFPGEPQEYLGRSGVYTIAAIIREKSEQYKQCI
jgi:hypothetical protein